jgi:hypothetical protein
VEGTENIVWKVPTLGKKHASPIVWADRIFVVTALPAQKQRLLCCLYCSNGKMLWQRVVLKAPLERIHTLNSYTSSTPATDGRKVYFSFLDRVCSYVPSPIAIGLYFLVVSDSGVATYLDAKKLAYRMLQWDTLLFLPPGNVGVAMLV